MVTKRVIISGRVQGVYYRDSAREQANKLGVKGWIRNRPDGDVEAVLQGDENAVKKMIEWCWEGSPRASVSNVEVFDEDGGHNYDDFKISF